MRFSLGIIILALQLLISGIIAFQLSTKRATLLLNRPVSIAIPANNLQDDFVELQDRRSEVSKSRYNPNDNDEKELLLTTYNASLIYNYFQQRPLLVVERILTVGVPLATWWINTKLDALKSTSPDSATALQAQRARELREAIVQGKSVTFIKSGQALALRSDIIKNPIYIAELSKLQDAVGNFPDDIAKKIMSKELGQPVDSIFEFDPPSPIASASIGQVYRARFTQKQIDKQNKNNNHSSNKDNDDNNQSPWLAIKVQRPEAQQTIAVDLFILRIAAAWFKRYKQLRSDLVGIVDQFGCQLYNELNYEQEGINARRFQQFYGDMPGIKVPKIYTEYTRRRVLTMEFVDGRKPPWATPSPTDTTTNDNNDNHRSNTGKKQAEIERAKQLLRLGLQCSVTQLFGRGFFHADPHRGNLLMVTKPSNTSTITTTDMNDATNHETMEAELAYLDFGMMAYVPIRQRYALISLLFGLANRDVELVVPAMQTLGFFTNTQTEDDDSNDYYYRDNEKKKYSKSDNDNNNNVKNGELSPEESARLIQVFRSAVTNSSSSSSSSSSSPSSTGGSKSSSSAFLSLNFTQLNANLLRLQQEQDNYYDSDNDRVVLGQRSSPKNTSSSSSSSSSKITWQIPPYITTIIRSLTMLEGLALEVESEFKLIQDAYPYLAQLLLSFTTNTYKYDNSRNQDKSNDHAADDNNKNNKENDNFLENDSLYDPEIESALQELLSSLLLFPDTQRIRWERLEKFLMVAVGAIATEKNTVQDNHINQNQESMAHVARTGTSKNTNRNENSNNSNNLLLNAGLQFLLLSPQATRLREALVLEIADLLEDVGLTVRELLFFVTGVWLFVPPAGSKKDNVSPNTDTITTTSSSGSNIFTSDNSDDENESAIGRPADMGKTTSSSSTAGAGTAGGAGSSTRQQWQKAFQNRRRPNRQRILSLVQLLQRVTPLLPATSSSSSATNNNNSNNYINGNANNTNEQAMIVIEFVKRFRLFILKTLFSNQHKTSNGNTGTYANEENARLTAAFWQLSRDVGSELTERQWKHLLYTSEQQSESSDGHDSSSSSRNNAVRLLKQWRVLPRVSEGLDLLSVILNTNNGNNNNYNNDETSEKKSDKNDNSNSNSNASLAVRLLRWQRGRSYARLVRNDQPATTNNANANANNIVNTGNK